ncbi:GNAT family N-acetyltransferase [Nostocoides jenkinsii]|uniref:Acetyltransferase n=1 Tax=Nostocoides jenkinsii Ben 74 TaxID=1193518 RepID=A0A077MGE6_9MICO|nr:GNAT family N-acetyltransferase [Tetrasphaera jenkinsii]CCI54748.1 Acetyltransferase [Tetrasphaera jenkinsii Ben 74]
MTPADLLVTFHQQVRLGAGEGSPRSTRTRHGHVFRIVSTDPDDPWAMVDCPEGLGADPDRVIAGERDHFGGLGIPLEWKTYTYDEPADLGDRLIAAGFSRGDDEALMLGELTDLARDVAPPAGVTIRRVATRGDQRRIRALYDLVWDGAWGQASDDSSRDAEPVATDPAESALLAEESLNGPVLCAARVNLTSGTEFAGMWGGSTHPDWRRRGLFRAMLAERARWALAQGYRYARVDASPDSEPILRSLGLHRVSTTVPYAYPAGP